jgi:cytochrome oxidase Cu insertion factor (SCO1/SenC/PrrC family)
VIGVSVDDEGWKVVKPFLKSFPESYTMAVGDAAISRNYGIANMPNTFVIDRQGRIAAAYRAGLVNKDDIEVHIRQLLAGD